jgi:hypothetical protein
MRSIYTFFVTFCLISLVPVNCNDRLAFWWLGKIRIFQGMLKTYPWFRLWSHSAGIRLHFLFFLAVVNPIPSCVWDPPPTAGCRGSTCSFTFYGRVVFSVITRG